MPARPREEGDAIDRNAFLMKMSAWLVANPLTYAQQIDGPALTLVERATGKTRVLSGDDVEEMHMKTNRISGAPYHILILPTGAQLAVTDVGFCFAPSF